MTVIVYFADFGIGISDLLITIDGSGQWPYLPSVGIPGASIRSLPFYPSRLVRKLGKLSLAGQTTPFMIAGTLSHIDYFLNVAQELAAGSRGAMPLLLSMDRNKIGSVLNAAARIADFYGRTDVRVIGLRGKETIGVSPVRRNFKYFGNVWLAGSGAHDIEVYLEERAEVYSRIFATDTEDMKAYRVMHYLPIQMLHADRQETSLTLSAGVGAFYEVLLNYKGKLEPDRMSWLRIILSCESELQLGARIRGLWWHYYENDDLVIVSAPNADLDVSSSKSTSLPMQQLRVDRFAPYSQPVTKEPGSLAYYLRKIPQTKFFSFGMYTSGDSSVLALSMAARKNAPVQIMWSPEGLRVQLHPKHFPDFYTSLNQDRSTLA